MTYEPPKYPAAIPSIEDLPDRIDDIDWLYAARYNELKKELRAALIELGILPKGTSASIAERLKGVLSLSDAVADTIIIKENMVGIGKTPASTLDIKQYATLKGISLRNADGDVGCTAAYSITAAGLCKFATTLDFMIQAYGGYVTFKALEGDVKFIIGDGKKAQFQDHNNIDKVVIDEATGNMDVVGHFTAATIQADNGWSGQFAADGVIVTVLGGIITSVDV